MGIRHLPTQDRRLLAPQALFANDAQWIVQKDSTSTANDETASEPNVVHMDVPSAFILALGIKSVRERILSGTQAARQLECPNARDVARFNQRRYGIPHPTSERTTSGSPRGSAAGIGSRSASSCLGFVLDDVLRTLDRSSLRASWVRVHLDERTFPREKLVHTYVVGVLKGLLCKQQLVVVVALRSATLCSVHCACF